jgi:autotransporter-associated beta strand protein
MTFVQTKTTKVIRRFFAVTTASLIAAVAGQVATHAATVSWSSAATNSSWSLGSNWVGGVAPQAGDDVIVYGGTTAGKFYGSNNTGFGTIALNSLTLAATEGNISLTLSSTVSIGAGGIDVKPTASARLFFDGPILLTADQTWKGTRPINPNSTAPISGPYKVTYDGTGAATLFANTNSPSWTGGLDIRSMVSQLQSFFAVGTTITPFGTGTITMTNRKTDGTTAVSPEFRVNAPSTNNSVATAYTYANNIVLSDPSASGNFSIMQDQNSALPSSGSYHYYIFSGTITGNVNAARQLNFLTVNSLGTGSGAFILTGNNTYTAQTVTDASTLLQIGNGGTAGTLGTGTVANSGILRFNRSDALTVANILTGTGQFQQAGTGTTTFSGANTYTGPTTISSGGLQIGGGGSAGTLGIGTVTNAGILLFNRSDALTVSNTIGGAGILRQVGNGTTSLTAANPYTGATEVAVGTLRLGAGATAGSIGSTSGVSVASGATLAFNRTDAYGGAFDRTISGSGSVLLSSGTLTLSGANTHSGGTQFTASTLVVGNAGALGTGLVTGTTNAVLAFNLPSSGTVANNFLLAPSDAGSSVVNQSTTSTVTLSGVITATNNLFFTFAGQGVNQAGFVLSGSTTFPSSRLIVKDTSLTIASSNAVPVTTFGNRISLGDSGGSGAAVYLADGVSLGVKVVDANNNDIIAPLAMTVGMNTSGSSTFAGVFGGDALDLHVRNTGGTGNTWNVTAPAGATVNFTGRIVNTGTNFQAPLTKTGLGTVVFSGSNTYGGATTVAAGKLLVNGQITNSAVSVTNGGSLGGSGTILTAVTIGAGALLSPGNSPGLLSVGSLSLDAGSTTLMEIDALARGTGFDAVNVTSGLTYGGTLQLAFSNTFADNTTFNLFNLTTGTPLGGLSSIVATGNYGSLTFTNNAGVWSSGPTSVSGQTMTFTEANGNLVIVPEPQAALLALLGVATIGWAARRRR